MADNILKNIRIKHRSDTEAKWTSQNPVLLNGELAISSDKFMYKTGNGTSTWSQLPYNSAVSDSSGQNIRSTYLKNIAASGTTLTLTKGDNATSTITTQDTKNTTGCTNSTSKLFIIGSATQGTNPQTYSRSTCYIGTDGCLYSNNVKVSVDGHIHSYLPLSGGATITTVGTVTTGTWNASTITVSKGGTGLTALTAGYALIGNGTGAVVMRAITNNTSATAITANTNLVTANALYYTLPSINGARTTSSTSVYAPTSYGTSGQVLKSNGNSVPTWVNTNSLNVASANTAATATKASGVTDNAVFDFGLIL